MEQFTSHQQQIFQDEYESCLIAEFSQINDNAQSNYLNKLNQQIIQLFTFKSYTMGISSINSSMWILCRLDEHYTSYKLQQQLSQVLVYYEKFNYQKIYILQLNNPNSIVLKALTLFMK